MGRSYTFLFSPRILVQCRKRGGKETKRRQWQRGIKRKKEIRRERGA
jgi:hypothetical protein